MRPAVPSRPERRRRLLAALGSLAAWLAFASPPAAAAPGASAVAPQAGFHGFLWEARKPGRHAYLMGTLHVGQASDYPPDADTQRRLSQVDAVVLEVDASQMERSAGAVRRLALYADSEPGLDQRIDGTLKAGCERAFALGLSPAEAWRMKPWMLATTLEVLQAMALGYSPAYSTEGYLVALAQAQHKPILELEGVEAQLSMLDAPPFGEQVDFLRQAVQSIEGGQAVAELRALVAAWRASDARAMQAYLDRVRLSEDPVERRWFARLVTARNAEMVDSIDALLRDGRFYLVAVGSLHFFGEAGLVQALRTRGYTVTPLGAAPAR
jgi:uncharacterized protein